MAIEKLQRQSQNTTNNTLNESAIDLLNSKKQERHEQKLKDFAELKNFHKKLNKPESDKKSSKAIVKGKGLKKKRTSGGKRKVNRLKSFGTKLSTKPKSQKASSIAPSKKVSFHEDDKQSRLNSNGSSENSTLNK